MAHMPKMYQPAKTPVPQLSPIYDKWEWQHDGACRNVDPEIFFLEDRVRGSEKREREQKAKKVCQTCPVINECLQHALTVPETYGVWGGMTADERFMLLKGKKPFYRS